MNSQAIQQRYRQSERGKATIAAYKKRNKAKLDAYQKAWRDKNRVAIRARQAEQRTQNRDKNKEWQRRYRQSDAGRAKHRAYFAAYYSTPAKRIGWLAYGAIRRAKLAGIAYDPNLRERLMANPPTQCACCQRELDYAASNRGRSEAVPSLDRVDNGQGYTRNNTAVICRRCNRLKGDATVADLDMIRRYIEREAAREQR